MKKILDKAKRNLGKKRKISEKEPESLIKQEEEKNEFQDNVYWSKNFGYSPDDLIAEFEDF